MATPGLQVKAGPQSPYALQRVLVDAEVRSQKDLLKTWRAQVSSHTDRVRLRPGPRHEEATVVELDLPAVRHRCTSPSRPKLPVNSTRHAIPAPCAGERWTGRYAIAGSSETRTTSETSSIIAMSKAAWRHPNARKQSSRPMDQEARARLNRWLTSDDSSSRAQEDYLDARRVDGLTEGGDVGRACVATLKKHRPAFSTAIIR